jgi:hypothetical protein
MTCCEGDDSCSTSWLVTKTGSTISTHKRNERAWSNITRHLQKRPALYPLPAKLWELSSGMLKGEIIKLPFSRLRNFLRFCFSFTFLIFFLSSDHRCFIIVCFSLFFFAVFFLFISSLSNFSAWHSPVTYCLKLFLTVWLFPYSSCALSHGLVCTLTPERVFQSC